MTMPVAPEAILQDHEGRSMLRFERHLHHPPDWVWQALTELDELRAWHPSPFTFEPRPGSPLAYAPLPDGTQLEGELVEYDPPRLLAYTWGDDLLRWEIDPEGDGSRLVLLHVFDDRYKAARDAAGWHLCLDALSAALEGARPPQGEDGERLPGGWRELNAAYEERFGIPPEKATPPPKL
jgi:uncharacterized protein YndB with AHSA1/START domain